MTLALQKRASTCARVEWSATSFLLISTSGVWVSRIVFRIHIIKAKRPNRRYLRDVLSRPGPVEVRRVAGENYHGTGRIRLQFLGIELIAQPNVEDTGNDRVRPVLWVLVWHQLHAVRHLDPDGVKTSLRRSTYNDGEAHRRGKGSERLPLEIFGQNCLENGLPWLMRSCSLLRCFRLGCCLRVWHRTFLIAIDFQKQPEANVPWMNMRRFSGKQTEESFPEALLLLYEQLAGIGKDHIMQEHCVVVHFFALDLHLFTHLSFAARGVGDLPQLAGIVQEHRLSTVFCAGGVASSRA